jgi:mannose/fructose/N-acetylgalactosamine-specific phosphotransferase system component IIC
MRLQKIRLAILGLWLGAMAFFSFVVAPAAFATLPQQQLAGALVSRTLGALEIGGAIIGALLIAILLFSRERDRAFLYELIALALMTVSMLVSHFVVSRRMHDLRVSLGEIAQLAATDPARLEFDRLHQYSVWLMGFDILGAIALIVYLARRNA